MTAALRAAARASIARGSRSFALASRLLDPVSRDRATLLYAWCRHCDDVIDEQDHGEGRMQTATSPAARLTHLRAATDAALAGRFTDDPPFDALALVVRETGLPPRYPHDLLDGFAIDVEGKAFATEADLLRYCYHVAGCVGIMMALVMGVAPSDHATLARACDLGLSFQLNNIARDIGEDAAIGRCYLPASWLAAENLSPADYFNPANRPALHRVATRLVNLAEIYEASALYGVPALSWRQAWAILAAARIYGDIGRIVRATGTVALDQRTRTSPRQKLAAVTVSLPPALDRHRRWPARPRANLWTPDFSERDE